MSVAVFTWVQGRDWGSWLIYSAAKDDLSSKPTLCCLKLKGLKMSSLLFIGFICAIQNAEKKVLLMTVHVKKDVRVLN